MTNKELLSTLLSQHANLRLILINIEKEINSDFIDAEKISNELYEFKIRLTEHLTLEDGAFYPEVLKVLKDKGSETKNTEEFIAQMKVLGALVFGFLDKYNSEEKILGDITEFKREYEDMTGLILLRVAVEEEGVYMYLS